MSFFCTSLPFISCPLPFSKLSSVPIRNRKWYCQSVHMGFLMIIHLQSSDSMRMVYDSPVLSSLCILSTHQCLWRELYHSPPPRICLMFFKTQCVACLVKIPYFLPSMFYLWLLDKPSTGFDAVTRVCGYERVFSWHHLWCVWTLIPVGRARLD